MPGEMAFSSWFGRIRSLCRRETAQTMAEYAVVLAVITPGIILVMGLFSDDIARLIDSVRALF
jgi:Flp pilus assembly pilin Flp